jgi:putative Holliday junction resolvase
MSGHAAASRPLSFLAFDFGLKRVGVASGNTVLGAAHALTTISDEGDRRFARIEALIAEWQPDALVVGVPFHPDGAEHDNTRRARRFARQLHGRFRLPVHEVDERYSTTEAAREGGDVDAASAAVILDQHLRTLR